MFKHLLFIILTLIAITSCGSQKMTNASSEPEKEQNSYETILQKYIKKYNFKNPEISYNSNKSYALCTDIFQGSRLTTSVDFFIYDIIQDSIIEKSSIIGDIYWKNDYTIVLATYQGIVRKSDLQSPKKSLLKEIQLKNHKNIDP